MKNFLIPVILCLLTGCRHEKPELLLHGWREAPLGSLHLELYADESFVYTTQGLRNGESYTGTYSTRADTLLLSFRDSVPDFAGQKFLFTDKGLTCLDKPGGFICDVNKIRK